MSNDKTEERDTFSISEVIFGIDKQRGNDIQDSLLTTFKGYVLNTDSPTWTDGAKVLQKEVINKLETDDEKSFAYLTMGMIMQDSNSAG